MKSITLSAEDAVFEKAQARAESENCTLDEVMKRWLEDYAQRQDLVRRYQETMSELRGKVVVGRKFTRDEMNER